MAAAQRPKRPRVVAPPQQLPVKVELTGSYTPVQHSASVDQALSHALPADTSALQAACRSGKPSDPLAGLRAKDDDPRMWGDAPEDLAESMKREKPPHWG